MKSRGSDRPEDGAEEQREPRAPRRRWGRGKSESVAEEPEVSGEELGWIADLRTAKEQQTELGPGGAEAGPAHGEPGGWGAGSAGRADLGPADAGPPVRRAAVVPPVGQPRPASEPFRAERPAAGPPAPSESRRPPEEHDPAGPARHARPFEPDGSRPPAEPSDRRGAAAGRPGQRWPLGRATGRPADAGSPVDATTTGPARGTATERDRGFPPARSVRRRSGSTGAARRLAGAGSA